MLAARGTSSCAGVSLHALPGHRVLVVVDEGLHEQLVAEDAAVEDLVALVGGHDVLVALGAGARLELRLRHDELRRLGRRASRPSS